jgi:hypothetical protein
MSGFNSRMKTTEIVIAGGGDVEAMSGMPVEHAEARNMVFHKVAGRPHRFPMSKTTEPVIAPRPRAPQPQLAAEWQNGVETISGFSQRKLRLVLLPRWNEAQGAHHPTRAVRLR